MSGVEYTGTRYMELAAMLDRWGYGIVPDAGVSRWEDQVRAAPQTGLIALRAEKAIEDVLFVFNIREFWEEGVQSDRVVRQGASLARYHYHGSAYGLSTRFCLYDEGHPDAPFHRHPWGRETGAVPYELIEPEDALAEFEKEVFLHLGGDPE